MNVARETCREKFSEAGELEGPVAKGALATALALCRRNKISLTPGRRRILEILACEGRPLGAYEMIDRVAQATGKRPAPISIYRALDFLLENSLVHRLAPQRLSRLRPRSRRPGTDRLFDLRGLWRSRRGDLSGHARGSRRPCGGSQILAPRAGHGSGWPLRDLRCGLRGGIVWAGPDTAAAQGHKISME